MGNCKVMTGEFGEAFQWFRSGSTLEPRATAGHCVANGKQAKLIFKALIGRDYRVKVKERIVFVETSDADGRILVPGEGHFPMAGNRGNCGNIPYGMVTASGGKGYPGMAGYSVVIVSRNG